MFKPSSAVSLGGIAATFENVVAPVVEQTIQIANNKIYKRNAVLNKCPPLEIVKRDVDHVRGKDGEFLRYPGTKTNVMVHKGIPCSRLREMRYKAKRAQAGRWAN